MIINEIQITYSNQRVVPVESITSSVGMSALCRSLFDDQISVRESFYALYLDRGNQFLGYQLISHGGISGTVADIRLVLSAALKLLATNIVICHNHPSGRPNPSESDKALTRKFVTAAKYIDMNILDHVIVTPKGEYFSFIDEGLL